MIIGYQGSEGSYSHEACERILEKLNFKKSVTFQGHTLSEEVFTALKKKEIDLAVLPVENSIIGNIDINTELIQNNNVRAYREYYLEIRHVLYSSTKKNISKIKKVYSHPAALAQCHDFIKNEELIPMVEYDTGGACNKMIKGKYTQDSAVIAGPHCAKIYDLHQVKNNIQKTANNYTRFLLIGCHEFEINTETCDKFSISFSTNNNPGALLEVLSYFRELKINLTKLESMPIPETPFNYNFFVDGELVRDSQKESTQLLEKVKEIFTKNKIDYKLIGHYPTHPRSSW